MRGTSIELHADPLSAAPRGARVLALLLVIVVGLACSSGGSGGGGAGPDEVDAGGGGGGAVEEPVGNDAPQDPPGDTGAEGGDPTGDGEAPLPAPTVREVPVRWLPSPTPGVEGYLLSIGNRSGAYDTALVLRNDQLTLEGGGVLSMQIELPGELDHYLAMRAFDGDAVSVYSNEIFIPALQGGAVGAAGSGEDALLAGSAFVRETQEVGSTGAASDGGPLEGGTAVAIAGAAEEQPGGLDGDDLRFELRSKATTALELSVTTPSGNEVRRAVAPADDCAYAGFETTSDGSDAEVVDCIAPALGPYLLKVENGSGADLPAGLWVFERGVERARFDLLVPAGGEVLEVYENALEPAGCSVVSVGREPLHQLGLRTYLGFEGGLYPEGAVEPPPDHANAGRARAARVRPLDLNGEASEAGAVVVLALGTANASRQFEALTDLAVVDPDLREEVVWVNGAGIGGEGDGGAPDVDRVRDEWLGPAGLSEAQVQVIWLAQANGGPEIGLPDPDAGAFSLLAQLGSQVRGLHARYPNLQLVLLASPVYGGYATGGTAAEPFAYESAFAVKWLVEGQIRQNAGLGMDAVAGDLAWEVAPWIGWGPYLWGDGLEVREDGLVWECVDFVSDGLGLSSAGEAQAAGHLLEFFRSSPFTAPWTRL